jgi:outer membrane protein OmpA-like peptidoglycan-associated protein
MNEWTRARRWGPLLCATLTLAACDRPAPDPSTEATTAVLREALGAPTRTTTADAGARRMTNEAATAALREVMNDAPPLVYAVRPQPHGPELAMLSAPWLVRYATGSARLRARDAQRLAMAASAIGQLPPEATIEVHGHADATGDEARNVALSRARAEGVVEALVRLGVPRERLRAVGHGSSEPMVPDAPRDRWRNRRVALAVAAG